jgi:hypothetical protein
MANLSIQLTLRRLSEHTGAIPSSNALTHIHRSVVNPGMPIDHCLDGDLNDATP